MAITVACHCGKRFAAKPHLAGKTVNCPVCRQPITIPLPQPAAVPKTASVIACRCGARYRAQPHLAGLQFACKRCGGQILVPEQAETPVCAEVVPDDSASVDEGFSYGISTPPPSAPSVVGQTVRSVPDRAAGGRRKRPMPESAQMACAALAGLGFLIVVLVVGIHSISGPGDIDDFGQAMSTVAICLAVAALVSALMIWLRVPVLGQLAGVLVALCVLPTFPIGTCFSAFILYKLLDKETQNYLRP